MLTIRHATPADIPALLPLNAIVQAWHATHYPDRFRKTVDPEYVRSFFEAMIEGETSFVDLALWGLCPPATCSPALTPMTAARSPYPAAICMSNT
ncbi:MAG: hypothetical protein ABJ251_22455 [Paracoccaceae bacterium]